MALAACAVALVLLLDVSGSVNQERYVLQRDGTASGIRSPEFVAAVKSAGSVAVTVIEWSYMQKITVPWVILKDQEDADALAVKISASVRSGGASTGMGGAVMSGLAQLGKAPCEAERLVMDISGDGRSNMGVDGYDEGDHEHGDMMDRGSRGDYADIHTGGPVFPMKDARAKAERAGVQINGLPIVTAVEPDVAEWYRANVPTNGGFIIEAAGFQQFADAMRKKLLMEITGLPVVSVSRFAAR